jgi:hypothetical protein
VRLIKLPGNPDDNKFKLKLAQIIVFVKKKARLSPGRKPSTISLQKYLLLSLKAGVQKPYQRSGGVSSRDMKLNDRKRIAKR